MMGQRKYTLIQRIKPTKVYIPGMHKSLPKRLNWDKIEAKPQGEGRKVVKGLNKRVVVIKSPDPKIFEQAIFIVREDYRSGSGREVDVLKEAEKVANDYLKNAVSVSQKFLSKIPPLLFAASGALVTALVCLALHFLGI